MDGYYLWLLIFVFAFGKNVLRFARVVIGLACFETIPDVNTGPLLIMVNRCESLPNNALETDKPVVDLLRSLAQSPVVTSISNNAQFPARNIHICIDNCIYIYPEKWALVFPQKDLSPRSLSSVFPHQHPQPLQEFPALGAPSSHF